MSTRFVNPMDWQAVEDLEESARTTHRRIRVSINSICVGCQNAHIYRSRRQNDPIVVCQHGRDHQVPLDIEECNHLTPMGQLDISTLARMATRIEKDQKEKAGFIIPSIGAK